MTRPSERNADTSDREIVISRVLTASRELVWQAWTDPQQVARWWGPDGFSTTIKRMEFRVGGVWEHVMHGPDGKNYPNKSTFTEIVPLERIVYRHGGGREGGPGATFVATWTFAPVDGGKTRLTGRMVFPTAEARDFVAREFGAVEGGRQTLGRLHDHLATVPLLIERTLDAPVALVWRALTDLTQMQRWYMTQLASFEPVVGFRTQFTVHHAGKDFAHHWEVTEVVPERRIAYTWRYEGFPGQSLVTFELSAVEPGKTRLRLTHAGLDSFRPGENPDLATENFLGGWSSLAVELQRFLEQAGPVADRRSG